MTHESTQDNSREKPLVLRLSPAGEGKAEAWFALRIQKRGPSSVCLHVERQCSFL